MVTNSGLSSTADDVERFRYLFENVQDAIVDFEFVDGEPVIRAVNDGFVDMFGVEREAALEEPLNDIIVPSDAAAQSERFDRRTAAGKSNYAIVDRRTANGVQTLLYRGIPYRGGDCGFALYTDLTDEIRQERELAVLNRVLRHNLRQTVDTLVENAETLLETADDAGESAEAIRESALELDRLSEEARDIERVLDADPELQRTDITSALERALSRVPRADDATLAVDVESAPPVSASDYLDRALAALIDNAIRYTEAGTAVEVTASRACDTVTLTVADRGPGLPSRERRVLTGELELTPLDHGSGLGLWLVRWIVTASDGDISYRERDGGGSAISITLPVAEK